MLLRRIVPLFTCAAFALFIQSASAALVNWDVLTWTPGTLSNSYDVDPSRPGSDVTFTITTSKMNFTNDKATGTFTPAITMSLQGGVSPLQKSLQLVGDLGTNSKVTMTVGFSSLYTLGVNNVSFSIFDIDVETNRDVISGIFGIAMDGSKVAPKITYGSAISSSGGGQGQTLTGIAGSADSGPTSGAGTATISFGATPIKGFAFMWSNSNGSPFYQQIALGDISFSLVPEANAASLAFAVCFLAALIRNGRR